jgi:hypothetical protein
MPASSEISEEGFGGFRNTWFLGRVPIDEASEVVADEARLIAWLDGIAQTSEEFEALAVTIESSELADMSNSLRNRAAAAGLEAVMSDPSDFAPLGGLEIGVSGLVHALSAIRCLTAASCRSHPHDRSWSDCPVVFFAAPAWRLQILAGMVGEAGCGLGIDRGILTIYAPCIREMHQLAELIVQERRRFRKRPAVRATGSARRNRVPTGQQLSFLQA